MSRVLKVMRDDGSSSELQILRQRREREILTSEIRLAQVVVLCCCLDKLITLSMAADEDDDYMGDLERFIPKEELLPVKVINPSPINLTLNPTPRKS